MNLIRYHLQHYAINSRLLRVILFVPLWIAKKARNRREKRLLRYYDQVVYGGNLIIGPTNFPGKFKVSATSDLATRVVMDSAFEPELTSLLARFSDIGGVVVNIGANIGFYSVFFAKQFPNVRKVVAIEPNPEAADLLRWNIAENGVENRIELLQMCISEQPGQVEVAYIPGKSEFSSIGEIVHSKVSGLTQHHVLVDAQPLSKAMSGQTSDISLVFVDTEGAEFMVLKGAEDVIKQSSPLLVFECEDDLLKNFNHSSAILESYIAGLGYEIRDASAPRRSPIHPFSGVVIAVPTNRKDWLDILQDSPAI